MFKTERQNDLKFALTSMLRVIHAPEKKGEMIVTFNKVYTSASGNFCSTSTIKKENDSKHSDGLACLNKDHEWNKSPLEIKIIHANKKAIYWQ